MLDKLMTVNTGKWQAVTENTHAETADSDRHLHQFPLMLTD